MSQNKTLKNYVSEIDQFLQAFDKRHPQLSVSQKQERDDYRQIYYLRDVAKRPDQPKKSWEDL